MRSIRTLLLSSMLAASATAVYAAGTVEVAFVKPLQFADAGPTPIERERNLKTLESHFLRAGAALLAPGQTLRLEVLDVNLAGTVEPQRQLGDLRIVRGSADWPSITLRYALEQNGQVLKSGEDRLVDLDYQNHLAARSPLDALPYEKRLVDDWARSRFGTPAVGS